MVNEDRLTVEITKSGFQAAIDNTRDDKGFKIKISEAKVYDIDNKERGRFSVVGKNIGQQQISLRIQIADKNNSYGIKTIKLVDKYSGVDFAIIYHPKGEMIDYVNPRKIAYIICNIVIDSLECNTVTIVDSSTVDANTGILEEQIADIKDKLDHLPGVNAAGNQDTTGNAATATKLQVPRKIGGVLFDGSQDIDLPGVNIIGNQHTTGNAATASYAAQIAARKIGGVIFNAKTDIDLPGVNITGNQDTTGNAATATKLQVPRKIGGVSFDGSTDIDLPGVNIAGKQDTSGNANTANQLKTARLINGIPFDGSRDVNTIPSGAIMYFSLNNAPTGWLKANGAALSRTTYANLFAAIGTLYGSGDGRTTFNLPDFRGEFIRSWDDGRNLDGGRGLGSWQDSQNRNHGHDGTTWEAGAHNHSGWTQNSGDHNHGVPISTNGSGSNFESNGGNVERWGNTNNSGVHNHYFVTDVNGNHTHNFRTNDSGGNESRPRNVALLACIKI